MTGPHRVDTAHPDLTDGLAQLWGRVAVAGGAVGFGPNDPVEEVHSAATEVVEGVTAKRAYLITLGEGHVLVGAAVLKPNPLPARRHTGEFSLFMVDPELQGRGWGQQLHDALLAQAQARGLERLELFARSGQALERFYESNGWVEQGRWPGAVRIAEADDQAEVWFTREV